MSQLLLVRHGQARFGTGHYDRLSPAGLRQARLVGRGLSTRGLCPDVIITGTLDRQQHTARLATEAFDDAPVPVVDANFDEYDADALFAAYIPRVLDENDTLAARRDDLHTDRRIFQKAFEQVMGHWFTGTPHDHAGCESWREFHARVSGALTRLHDDYPRDSRIAAFSSGGPIAVCIGQAMQASDKKMIELNWSIYNASISDLRSTRSGWRLLGFNDIGALIAAADPELVTFR